jgi:hypothetical protein
MRWHVLSGGLSVVGTTNLLAHVLGTSMLGGLSVPLGAARVDLLAELGARGYSWSGWGHEPGSGGIVPFAGARTGVSFRVSGYPMPNMLLSVLTIRGAITASVSPMFSFSPPS